MDPLNCLVNFIVNKVLVKAIARIGNFDVLVPADERYTFVDGRGVVGFNGVTSTSCLSLPNLKASGSWFDC